MSLVLHLHAWRPAVCALAAGLALAGCYALPSASPTHPGRAKISLSGEVAGLYPGSERKLQMRVRNGYPWRVEVQTITVRSTRSNKSGCSAKVVTSPGWTGRLRIARNASAKVGVPVRMTTSAPAACQGATFRLDYTAWGVRP